MRLIKFMSLAILGMALLGSCKKEQDSFSVQEKSITWNYNQATDTYFADVADDRITDFVLSYGSVDVEIKDVNAFKNSGYVALPFSYINFELIYCYQKGNVHLEWYNPDGTLLNPIEAGLGTLKVTVYKDLAVKRKSTPSFGKQKVKSIH